MTELLAAKGIHVAYGTRKILEDVSLSVGSGQIVGLIGANGAGKSTLLRVLGGLLEPEDGQVLLEGKAIPDGNPFARQVAYLAQETQCHWPLSVERAVGLGRLPHLGWGQRFGEKDSEAVERAMLDADVDHLRERDVTTLSGGEQARVFLARALAVCSKVLLADEPVAGLDPAHQLGVMELLKRKAGAGMGIICVLHDLTLAARYCDTLVLLHEGRVLAQGRAEDVMTGKNLHLALGIDALMGSYEGENYILPWRAVP